MSLILPLRRLRQASLTMSSSHPDLHSNSLSKKKNNSDLLCSVAQTSFELLGLQNSLASASQIQTQSLHPTNKHFFFFLLLAAFTQKQYQLEGLKLLDNGKH